MKLLTDIAIVLSTATAGFIAVLHGGSLLVVLPLVAIVAAIGVSLNSDDERRPRG